MRGFQAKCCTDAAQAQHVEQNRPNMAQLPDIGSSVSNRRSMELPSLMKFVTPPEMPYISSRALKGLRDYKYVAGGYTWLDRVHTPFWNRTVEFFPLWLAPNLITLIGTGWLVLGYLVSSTYLTEFKGDAPSWVYALSGLAVLLYLHLDCLDGKQARRTKTSSPLGQLFDHGCDALAVYLIIAMIGGTLDVGPGALGVVGTLAIMIPWIGAQWEEYHSGLMLYGNGVIGITELNYVLVIIHWLTAAFGPRIWRAGVFDTLHVTPPTWLPKGIQRATMTEVIITGVVLGAVQQLYEQVGRVVSSKGSLMAKQDRGHKLLGSTEALKQVAQFVLFFGTAAVFMLQPVVAPGQIAAVFATFGILYALQATHLIVSHMAKEPFELFWWPFTLLLVNLANTRLELVNPALFAWACAGIALGAYLHYVFSVIDQICGFLGIHCLTIPGPADGAVEKEVAVGSSGAAGAAKGL